MKNQLTREIDQREKCLYCSNSLKNNKWYSLFLINHHYKETNCDGCGRRVSIKINFIGTGHDFWDPNSEFYKKFKSDKQTTQKLEEKIK
jgi:hypothetical protein